MDNLPLVSAVTQTQYNPDLEANQLDQAQTSLEL